MEKLTLCLAASQPGPFVSIGAGFRCEGIVLGDLERRGDRKIMGIRGAAGVLPPPCVWINSSSADGLRGVLKGNAWRSVSFGIKSRVSGCRYRRFQEEKKKSKRTSAGEAFSGK